MVGIIKYFLKTLTLLLMNNIRNLQVILIFPATSLSPIYRVPNAHTDINPTITQQVQITLVEIRKLDVFFYYF